MRNGDRLFINNDRGELIIVKPSPAGYQEISRTPLIKPTSPPQNRRELVNVNWLYPAYANKNIYARNDEEIICASLAADVPVKPAQPARPANPGDLVVVFPQKRLAHLGDLFPGKAAPSIDTANGGSAVELPRTLARIVAELKETTYSRRRASPQRASPSGCRPSRSSLRGTRTRRSAR